MRDRNVFTRLMQRVTGRQMGTVTVNPDVVGAGFKGKARIEAVKRGPCSRCGGSYGFNPNVRQCECPEGWTGTEQNLGVIAESRIG